MDRSKSPGDDFYAYANGTFLRDVVIPPDRASTGSFLRVFEVEGRTRALGIKEKPPAFSIHT